MSDAHNDESDDAVLDLFGFKVHVSNPRFAEILRMDAREALTTDVRQLLDPQDTRRAEAALAQAAPDTLLSPQKPHDRRDVSRRSALRLKCDGLAQALGFTPEPDGSWTSNAGYRLRTRILEGIVSPAAAADMVVKLEALFTSRPSDEALLFIVENEGAVTSLVLAMRQRRAHHWARVARVDDLQALRRLLVKGDIDHEGVLAHLIAAASCDVGSGLPDPACGEEPAST